MIPEALTCKSRQLDFSSGWIADGNTKYECDATPKAAVSIPYYQLGVTSANGNSSYRNVPDVSIVGTDIETDMNQQRTFVRGTSLASPLWAGFMALVNEQNRLNGLGPVGFANPVLYAIARTKGNPISDVYGASFYDVQDHYNDILAAHWTHRGRTVRAPILALLRSSKGRATTLPRVWEPLHSDSFSNWLLALRRRLVMSALGSFTPAQSSRTIPFGVGEITAKVSWVTAPPR